MTGSIFHLSSSLEVWIGALLTLMVFSYLWRDNPLYKIAEHLFVGVSAAYWMVVGFWTTFWPNAVLKLWPAASRLTSPDAPPPEGDPAMWIPVGLGLLLLMRLVPRVSWLGRWPTAFIVGTTAGYTLVRTLRSDLLFQIRATLGPGLLAMQDGRLDPFATASRLVLVAGTVCGLVYFLYTRRDSGGQGRLARTGLLFMMVTFGATFGYAVMGRVSLLIGRLNALLGDWLGVI